jgi:hypothetical protein
VFAFNPPLSLLHLYHPHAITITTAPHSLYSLFTIIIDMMPHRLSAQVVTSGPLTCGCLSQIRYLQSYPFNERSVKAGFRSHCRHCRHCVHPCSCPMYPNEKRIHSERTDYKVFSLSSYTGRWSLLVLKLEATSSFCGLYCFLGPVPTPSLSQENTFAVRQAILVSTYFIGFGLYTTCRPHYPSLCVMASSLGHLASDPHDGKIVRGFARKINKFMGQLGLDWASYRLVLKGTIAPTIALACYQATHLAETFGLTGYLIPVSAIIS